MADLLIVNQGVLAILEASPGYADTLVRNSPFQLDVFR
jgi:hypothetical protein